MIPNRGAQGRSRGPAGARAVATTTMILWALGLAAPVALERFALSRRASGTPVPAVGASALPIVAADGRAVLEEWLRRGVTGRTVLHVGAFLHSVPPEGIGRATAPLRAVAGEELALREAIRRATNDRGYLWAAIELGVARRIVFVEPRASFVARAEGLDVPVPPPGEPLDLGVRGVDRVAFDRIPALSEPVLLDVAASWFDGAEDAAALRDDLATAGIRADVVTLNRLGGSADVSDAARERLDRFGALLSETGAPGAPR